MANIVSGVPHSYVPPISVGSGIPIEATLKSELRTADLTERELLILQCRLLFALLVEQRIGNEKNWPNLDWDNERTIVGDALAEEANNLSVDSTG